MLNVSAAIRASLGDRCAGLRPRGWSRVVGACLALACAGSAACAHGQAKTVTELPALDMPAPPPRIVEVVEPPDMPPVATQEVPATVVNPPAPPVERRGTPRLPEPARAEPTPADAAKTAEDPPRSSPPTTLQTTPTGREGEVERRIRVLIAQAFSHLNRVNYQALNANARNQYDTAKRFAVQAEEALQARNLVFASNLADKAAALAGQLPTR